MFQVINTYVNMVFISKSFPVTYGVVGSKTVLSASLIIYTNPVQSDPRGCCPLLTSAKIEVRMLKVPGSN